MTSVRSALSPAKLLLFLAGEQPAQAGYQNRRKPAPDAPSRILRHDRRAPFARRGYNPSARLPIICELAHTCAIF